MFSFLRPFLFKLDPEVAHDLAIQALKFKHIPRNYFEIDNEEDIDMLPAEKKHRIQIKNYIKPRQYVGELSAHYHPNQTTTIAMQHQPIQYQLLQILILMQ